MSDNGIALVRQQPVFMFAVACVLLALIVVYIVFYSSITIGLLVTRVIALFSPEGTYIKIGEGFKCDDD